MQAIKKAPFYAIYGNRWRQSTKGRNGIAVNSHFQVLNTQGEVIPGLWASGDGCTIFGDFVISNKSQGNWSEDETKARTVLSRALAQAMNPVVEQSFGGGEGGPGGGGPGGAQGGAQGGAPGAATQGGAPGAAAQSGAPGATAQGGAKSGANAMAGRGGMPMMMGEETPAVNILKGKSSPCGGLGPAFLSGYCAGTFAAAYLKNS